MSGHGAGGGDLKGEGDEKKKVDGGGDDFISISPKVMKSLKRAAKFMNPTTTIMDLSFHQKGEFLVVSSSTSGHSGGSIISSSGGHEGSRGDLSLYSTLTGTRLTQINCGKFGTDLVEFTHNNEVVLHSSTRINRHSAPVLSLAMASPGTNTFFSSSKDGCVKIWDLKSGHSHGLLGFPGAVPLVAAHPTDSNQFAVGQDNHLLDFYDLRSIAKGPFSKFALSPVSDNEKWSSLKYSPDGKSVMICSTAPQIRTCTLAPNTTRTRPGFDESLSKMYKGFAPVQADGRKGFEAAFTPQSDYMFCGDDDGNIHAWNVASTEKVWSGVESAIGDSVQLSSFNPVYLMLATGCGGTLSFWCHDEDDN